ncbi:MAG: hypothetical protein B7Z02_15395 [Rhodobacterales bacterium 32-67-9]|nr:MAG: hypothetical protein B7Z02_15395 [Rhodobacterales bacterium 32-67-9]
MTVLPPLPPALSVPVPGFGALSLHYRQGSGMPLLLLHGFTDCAESYRLLLPHLGDRPLAIPDLRGHGRSFWSDDMSLDSLAGDAYRMLRAIHQPKAVVVGHSLAALIALRLAGLAPECVAGLVLISGSLRPASPALTRLADRIRVLPDPLPVDHSFFALWHQTERQVPEPFLTHLAASAAAMRRRDWMACIGLLADADLRNEAASLHCPALVLSGGRDAIFDAGHQKELAAHLPDAEQIIFPDLGHNPHWEAPQEVAAAILGFCRARCGNPPSSGAHNPSPASRNARTGRRDAP